MSEQVAQNINSDGFVATNTPSTPSTPRTPRPTGEPRVLVMMAAYNGERYLQEQIDSILAQEDVRVTLWITDDCSSDGTASIIKHNAAQHQNICYRVNPENQGSTLTFMNMVYDANEALGETFDYYAFSDQDDFWFPEKLREAVTRLQAEADESVPLLYYSDVINTDASLGAPKQGEYAPFAPLAQSIEALLVCNFATGCTMVFNNALCGLVAQKRPASFPRIHDVWLHLIALTCGKTIPDLDRSFICRRISSQNQIGKRGFGAMSASRFIESAKTALNSPRHEYVAAAANLLTLYGAEMKSSKRALVEAFINEQRTLPSRIALACNKNYRLPTALDTFTMKLRIILNRC